MHVLDTSAVMAVLQEEPGSDQVTELLTLASEGERLLLPFMALMEVEYHLRRRHGAQDLNNVLAMIASWPVRVEESTPEWGHAAASVKANYRLSAADAWIAALAITHDARLVHKDPEFDPIRELQHFRLPYKPKQK